MDRNIALRMAEAFCRDCMNPIASLSNEDAESIIDALWAELTEVRDANVKLSRDYSKLRSEAAL